MRRSKIYLPGRLFLYLVFCCSLDNFSPSFTLRLAAHICNSTGLTASIIDIAMATSKSSQLDEPPYLSYRELQNELRSDRVPVIFCPDAKQRLFWPLDGVFPTSISVMKTPRSPDSLEPYFLPDTTGSGSGSGT